MFAVVVTAVVAAAAAIIIIRISPQFCCFLDYNG